MGYPFSRTNTILCLAIAVAICVFIAPASQAADVDVYAEGAYTATDLKVYIYADIHTSPILSYGVRVNYPAGLTFVQATKNEAVWYFGNGTAEYSYMDPQNDGSGVIIIGGKLDTSNATAGVTGNRVLLGTVTFSHSGMTDFSGVSLTYGRGDGTSTYKNFVATSGAVFDGAGITFNSRIVCALNGDANRDGVVNIADLGLVQANWMLSGSNIVDSRADLDSNGVVNIADLGLVQANWLKSCP